MRNKAISTVSVSIKGFSKEVNEDSYFVDNDEGILVVADGMFGDGKGKAASQVSVDVIVTSLKSAGLPFDNEQGISFALITDAFERANTAVLELKALGSTVVLACVCGDKVIIAHAGDSRAYLVRDGEIQRLTEDHSLIAAAIKMGEINEEVARKSPHMNILTRALGRMNHHPDVITVCWRDGDVFLLTTDGIVDVLDDSEIRDIVVSHNDLEDMCDKFIQSLIFKKAKDDVTIIGFKNNDCLSGRNR